MNNKHLAVVIEVFSHEKFNALTPIDKWLKILENLNLSKIELEKISLEVNKISLEWIDVEDRAYSEAAKILLKK